MAKLRSTLQVCKNGRELRKWRLEQGIQRKDAAEAVGVSVNCWFNWETGRAIPEEDKKRRLEIYTSGVIKERAWPVTQKGRPPGKRRRVNVEPHEQGKNF